MLDCRSLHPIIMSFKNILSQSEDSLLESALQVLPATVISMFIGKIAVKNMPYKSASSVADWLTV